MRMRAGWARVHTHARPGGDQIPHQSHRPHANIGYDAYMTGEGLRPRRLAELDPENLRRIVEDMGTGPGWYASGDLYGWYSGMCQEDGMEPVSKKRFGMVLGELGYKRQTRYIRGKNARCWFLSKRALRGGASPGDLGGESGVL